MDAIEVNVGSSKHTLRIDHITSISKESRSLRPGAFEITDEICAVQFIGGSELELPEECYETIRAAVFKVVKRVDLEIPDLAQSIEDVSQNEVNDTIAFIRQHDEGRPESDND